MGARVRSLHGETAQHARLKELAFLWAQAQGYSACAMEVSLPKCRYRADVAAYRLTLNNGSQVSCLQSGTGSRPVIRTGSTAIFECKQALCDLRRDNCQSDA